MSSDSFAVPARSIVLFVCLHGAAKSVIAAQHLSRLAEARGLAWRGESSGIEPDAELPEPVIDGLADDGIDARGYRPRRLTADHIAAASCVVDFGCDVSRMVPANTTVRTWGDLPLVSDGYAAARDAIIDRVARLLDEL